LVLVSLSLLTGVLPTTLLSGILIALTLLAGVLSATLLSGLLSTLILLTGILLTGILIGLVRIVLRIIRIVHSNVSLQMSPRITRLGVSHRFSGKSCVKNRHGEQDYFTCPHVEQQCHKWNTLKNIANRFRLKKTIPDVANIAEGEL
jgi:hypothetical protein